jgi:hypothetical protein
MKKSVIICTYFLLFFAISSISQNCGYFIPLKANTGTEMKNYDSHGKLTSTNKNTIISISTQGEYTVANLKAESVDEMKGGNSSTDYTIKCSGTQLIIDTKSLMSSAAMDNYKKNNYDIKMESIDIELPNKLTIGSSLKDSELKMKMYSNEILVTDMIIALINRKVESKESISTPAGTFNCFKITYDSKTTSKIMGFSTVTTNKVVEYYAENVGVVKSQTYDTKGNLFSYSVLNKVY